MSGVTSSGSKLIIGETNAISFNQPLVQAIVKSFYYHKFINEGNPPPELKTSSYARRIAELRFLPPKIIEAILNGTQKRDLTVKRLFEMKI